MKEYTCVRDYKKDGLTFIRGCNYKVNYNPINGRLYIHTVWGYTDITKALLNEFFF